MFETFFFTAPSACLMLPNRAPNPMITVLVLVHDIEDQLLSIGDFNRNERKRRRLTLLESRVEMIFLMHDIDSEDQLVSIGDFRKNEKLRIRPTYLRAELRAEAPTINDQSIKERNKQKLRRKKTQTNKQTT